MTEENEETFLKRNQLFIKAYTEVGQSLYIFNECEYFLNCIIIDFIKPNDCSFYMDFVLNSSITSTGVKLKILSNANIFNQLEMDSLRKYTSGRNTLAHSNRTLKQTFQNGIVNGADGKIYFDLILSDNLFYLNSNSKLICKDFDEFKSDFFKLQESIINMIEDYIINKKINTFGKSISDLKTHLNMSEDYLGL